MKNKIVFITGSSQGIGKEIAKAYAIAGYTVIINGFKNEEKLMELKQDLLLINPNVYAFKCDMSERYEIENLLNLIKTNIGSIDILINNVGISYSGLFNSMSYDEYDKILKTNLYSAITTTNLVLPHMISNKSGTIVNISSVFGQTGASCEVVYSVSKAGLDNFTKSLAKELGPSNIRVNGIACGFIDTEMNNNLNLSEKESILDEIPLCRFGTGLDVANLCMFLTSPESSYLTGQVITLDGGWK